MKNMKKTLLSLLLIPSLALTGCGKDDDSKNETPNTQEGGSGTGTGTGESGSGESGSGSGTGSGESGSGSQTGGSGSGESGGSQTPAGLTEAQQEAAYTSLMQLMNNVTSNQQKTFSIEALLDNTYSMSVKEDGLTPEEIEGYNAMLALFGGAGSEKDKSLASYDLNNGNFYSVEYSWDDELETWSVEYADYIVKSGNQHTLYIQDLTNVYDSDLDEWVPVVEKKAYNVGEDHLDRMYMDDLLMNSAVSNEFEGDTFAEFKTQFSQMYAEMYGVTLDSSDTIEITLEDGVYTLTAVINEKTVDTFDMGDMVLTDATISMSTEFVFTATELKSSNSFMSMAGVIAMPIGEDGSLVDVDMTSEMTMVENYSYTYNNGPVTSLNFEDFGEVTNYQPMVSVYVNGVKVGNTSLEYNTIINTATKEVLDSTVGFYASDFIENYYVDEECTTSYSTALETIPSYDFDLYTTVSGNSLEDGTAVVIYEIINSAYGYQASSGVDLITLSDLTDNTLNLDDYLFGSYTIDEVLVDGVATTGDIVLTNKQVVVITLNCSNSGNGGVVIG